MSVGRRHPGPPPKLPPSLVALERWLWKLLEGFSGHPAPHQETHLQGGADAFPSPATPTAVDLNLGGSAGAATNYSRSDHRHAVTTPLTTKGDLLTRDASAYVRHAVGANDQILVADSAQADGLRWTSTIIAAEEAEMLALMAMCMGGNL